MEIIWSNKARRSFLNIPDYLLAEWTAKEVDQFIKVTESHLKLIGSGIVNGRKAIKREKVFSVLLNKHNRLYYRLNQNKILLLLFWDMRRNPSKNPYE